MKIIKVMKITAGYKNCRIDPKLPLLYISRGGTGLSVGIGPVLREGGKELGRDGLGKISGLLKLLSGFHCKSINKTLKLAIIIHSLKIFEFKQL